MADSPYAELPVEKWRATTERLLGEHPLSIDELRKAVIETWEGVWATRVGRGNASSSLSDLKPPATVVGYFFERLLGKDLETKFPKKWRGGRGSEKDLHFIPDDKFSVEVKTSGQRGLKIFGNRSYGQKIENTALAKKDKSGYYLTVNFYEDRITLIRFGWIDGSDWVAQKSATGQMAGLPEDVYQHKLVVIPGDYVLDGPVGLLKGVGSQAEAKLKSHGITKIRDLLEIRTVPVEIASFHEKAAGYAKEFAGS